MMRKYEVEVIGYQFTDMYSLIVEAVDIVEANKIALTRLDKFDDVINVITEVM